MPTALASAAYTFCDLAEPNISRKRVPHTYSPSTVVLFVQLFTHQCRSLGNVCPVAPPKTYKCLSKATTVWPYLFSGGGGAPCKMCSVEIRVHLKTNVKTMLYMQHSYPIPEPSFKKIGINIFFKSLFNSNFDQSNHLKQKT